MEIFTKTRDINRRAFLVMFFILALLVISIGMFAISFLDRQILTDSHTRLKTEISLFVEVSLNPLLRSDYATVEELARSWAAQHEQIVKITVLMPNGFKLVEIDKQSASAETIQIEQLIQFNDIILGKLQVVSDIAPQKQAYTSIMAGVMWILIALFVLFGWVLWATLQRTALTPLAEQIAIREARERDLLQRTSQLEVANRELESFSYSVSHDLRAPLRALDGFSRLLIDEYGSKLDTTGQDFLRRIYQAARNMEMLIDDLLKLSRVTRTPMKLEAIDLSKMANQIMLELQRAAPERQAQILIAEGLHCTADRGLMLVAMENLLQNAWKYTAKNTSTQIEVGMSQQEGKPTFFIRDNGVGFDMQYSNKLFTAFQRLHKPDEFAGTGVGLATVARIIERHGGRIWAVSAVGNGATFYFYL